MTIIMWLMIGIMVVVTLYLLGQYTFWLPHKSAKLPRILMLHQVTQKEPASGMNMPPAKFEALLALLCAKQAKTVTMSEWLSYAQKQQTENMVALTFDDGFLDNYTEAFPLLQKYQMKATIYLSPHFEAINRMQPEHLQIMQQSGLIEFGAHTMTHPNLNNISDEQAMQEIMDSKQWVEKHIGYCHCFAYPFGRFSEKHMHMVEKAGFCCAVSTKKRILAFSANKQFCLPRISISGLMDSVQLRIALRVGRYRL